MAKARQVSFNDASAAIAMDKRWAGGGFLAWRPQGVPGFPNCHKCRATLSVNGVIQEGLFVDLFHKKSSLPHVPDKVSFSLVVMPARVFGLDENGISVHQNIAGRGMPFHMQTVDHPHLHFATPDSTDGYAEPVERQPIDKLWLLFLARANIEGAPPFRAPTGADEGGQLELL